MAGAQHIPELVSLRCIISSGQIRRSLLPSLVPNPSLRLGFRARHRLHHRRGSDVPGGSSPSSTARLCLLQQRTSTSENRIEKCRYENAL